jgi:hypothetical protein
MLGPDHTRETEAEQRLDAATDALNATDTYRFETDITVVASGEDRTERVDVEATGGVNLATRVMWANATHDDETRRSYTLNRTVYRECGERWNGWGVEELNDDADWASHTPAVRQLSLLASGSLYHNGTDTVDGREAVLLVGEPTAEAVTQYQERRSRSLFGGPSVENAEVRVWLDPQTNRPIKSDVRFEVSGGGGSATAEVTTRFTGYDDPVSVTNDAAASDTVYDLGCPG